MLVEIPICVNLQSFSRSGDYSLPCFSSRASTRCAGAGRDQDGVDRMRMGRRRDEDGKWTGRIGTLQCSLHGASILLQAAARSRVPSLLLERPWL